MNNEKVMHDYQLKDYPKNAHGVQNKSEYNPYKVTN